MTPTDHVMSRLQKLLERALDPDGGSEADHAIAAVRRWMKRNKRDGAWIVANVGKAGAIINVPLPTDWTGKLDWLDGKHRYLSDRDLEFVMRMRTTKSPSRWQLRRLEGLFVTVQMVAYQQGGQP